MAFDFVNTGCFLHYDFRGIQAKRLIVREDKSIYDILFDSPAKTFVGIFGALLRFIKMHGL